MWPKMDMPQPVLSIVSQWLRDEFAARWRLLAHAVVQRETCASAFFIRLMAAATTRMASTTGRLGGSHQDGGDSRHEAGVLTREGVGGCKEACSIEQRMVRPCVRLHRMYGLGPVSFGLRRSPQNNGRHVLVSMSRREMFFNGLDGDMVVSTTEDPCGHVCSVLDVSRADMWRHIVDCIVRRMPDIEELSFVVL